MSESSNVLVREANFYSGKSYPSGLHNFSTSSSGTYLGRTGYSTNGNWRTSTSSTGGYSCHEDYGGTGAQIASQLGKTLSSDISVNVYPEWIPNSYTISYNKNTSSSDSTVRDLPGSESASGGSSYTISSTVPWRYDAAMYGYGTSPTTFYYYPGDSISNITSDRNLYCRWETPTSISTNSSSNKTFYFAGQRRVYKFTPSESRKYRIYISSSESNDPDLYIYTSDSSTAWNSNTSSGKFDNTYSFNSGTTYYIHNKMYTGGTQTSTLAIHSIYNITYNANGGSGAPSSGEKEYGSTYTISSTKPSRSNSTSNGYKVSFNLNGGTSTTPSAITATNTTSYTFNGWNTSSAGSGTNYSSGGSYTGNSDLTLYAKWNSSTTNGSITLPSTPTKANYTFKGWYTASSGGTKAGGAGESYTPTSSLTLYAQWTANTYTVNYNGNSNTGGSTASSSHTYGVAKNLTANGFTRAYTVNFNKNHSSATNSKTSQTATYTFKNWNKNKDGSGTSYSN